MRAKKIEIKAHQKFVLGFTYHVLPFWYVMCIYMISLHLWCKGSICPSPHAFTPLPRFHVDITKRDTDLNKNLVNSFYITHHVFAHDNQLHWCHVAKSVGRLQNLGLEVAWERSCCHDCPCLVLYTSVEHFSVVRSELQKLGLGMILCDEIPFLNLGCCIRFSFESKHPRVSSEHVKNA